MIVHTMWLALVCVCAFDAMRTCRFYQDGASFIFPDAWESYLAVIPEEERGDLVAAYHKRQFCFVVT